MRAFCSLRPVTTASHGNVSNYFIVIHDFSNVLHSSIFCQRSRLISFYLIQCTASSMCNRKNIATIHKYRFNFSLDTIEKVQKTLYMTEIPLHRAVYLGVQATSTEYCFFFYLTALSYKYILMILQSHIFLFKCMLFWSEQAYNQNISFPQSAFERLFCQSSKDISLQLTLLLKRKNEIFQRNYF